MMEPQPAEMLSVALRCPHTRGRSLGIGKILVSLVIGVAACGLTAAETPVLATAKYSRGTVQLRLLSVSQDRSASSKNGFTAAMQFQLEFPQGEKQQYVAQLPAGFFLNNAHSPLLNAEVEPGKNLARLNHTGIAEGGNGVVTIDDLDIGPRRERLRNVDIEVALLRVTDWEQKKFEKIGLGATDFLQCGPFEFRVTCDPQQVRLSAWAYPQFKAEHEAYRKRVPLKFINSSYALDELKLVDDVGRSPTAIGIAGGGAGASIATYTNWRPAEGTTVTATDEISYPVTLSLRLPLRYETEAVKFHFDQIALPAPK